MEHQANESVNQQEENKKIINDLSFRFLENFRKYCDELISEIKASHGITD